MKDTSQGWYIIKRQDATCEIVTATNESTPKTSSWGPFSTYEEAIAKRIGLIRAGKCQPK